MEAEYSWWCRSHRMLVSLFVVFSFFISPPNENKISCWLVFGNVGNCCLQKRWSVLIHLGAVPVLLGAVLPEEVLWLWRDNPAWKQQEMKWNPLVALLPHQSWLQPGSQPTHNKLNAVEHSVPCQAPAQGCRGGRNHSPSLTLLTTQKGGASLTGHGTHTCQGRRKVLRKLEKLPWIRVWQHFSLTVRRIIYSPFSQAVEVYQHYRTARTKDSLSCPDAKKSYL